MRVSSPITPFFTGTFMSTRISTRLPASAWSVSFLNFIMHSVATPLPGQPGNGEEKTAPPAHRRRAGPDSQAANIARAVFSIWQEKPHSLSYQASTLTILPLETLVRVESKCEASEVWLKSIDTSGSTL